MKNFILILAFMAWAGVEVTDGDTIKLDGERVRLWGIDAPEIRQKCGGVACGEQAKEYLERIINDAIACEAQETDRYGRTVARCFVGSNDIGALMVEGGWALDYTQYSKGFYSEHENRAKGRKRGIWQFDFIPPWEWRRKIAKP